MAFGDPHACIELERFEDGEERWQLIGLIGVMMLVLVAYTTWEEDDGEEIVTIISARHATSHERPKYENEKNVH